MNSAYIDYTMASRMSFSMPKNNFFLLVICFSPIFSNGFENVTLHLKIAGYVVTSVSILYSGGIDLIMDGKKSFIKGWINSVVQTPFQFF